MNNQEDKLSVTAVVDLLSMRDEMQIFLKNNNINNDNVIESIDRYEAGEHRKGIIVRAQKNGDEKHLSVMIDVKQGEPTTDQVFDALYEKGAECQVKLILFTGGSIKNDRNDPGAYDLIVQNFIKNIRNYGVDIHLIQVTSSPDKFLHFELIEPEDYDAKIETDVPMPTQEVLRQHEFWDVYYWYSQLPNFMYPWECFEGSLDDSYEEGHYYGLNGLDLYARLSENGLSFKVMNNDGDYNYLETIWKCKKYEIQALFPDSKVTYVIPPGKMPRIEINVWDTPMSKICTASISEKKRWAEKIFNEFGELNGLMDSALWDLKEGKLEEVQEFVKLSDVA
jgi:hypothetical protein